MATLFREMRERNGAVLRYAPGDGVVEASAEVAGSRASMRIEWLFGAGAKAFTPVGHDAGGRWVEHRISWYQRTGRLALTLGHSRAPSPDAASALGIVQSPDSITRCFSCHATNVKPGPDLSAMRAGVTCERCHGPGSDHVAAARAGRPLRSTILNPGRFDARGLVAACSECHRSPNAEFRSEMPELEDPISIRFAPVGFQASACFKKSRDFSCTSCHDPHANPKPAADPAYTEVCLRCHASLAHAKQAKASCVGCHMKGSAPTADLSFTDHRIRIY